MTRTVLDNAMVAHVWAQQSQPEGRSFRAGCHNISWAQVERVAKLANVFDDAATDEALIAT